MILFFLTDAHFHYVTSVGGCGSVTLMIEADHTGSADQRWYMFQNMGPAPSARSGHAMASMGSRVFVLGGESFTPTRGDDHGMIHVLDTSLYLIMLFCSRIS